MMLDDTPPPTLNAAALRTFKELGFYILCLKSPLGSFLEEESILSSQGTFLCPSAFVKQWALQHPLPTGQNISPRHREMGPSLRPGEGLVSWP